MPIEVESPDGAIVEFPDGTPPETIKQVMRRQFGGPGSPAEADVAPPLIIAGPDGGERIIQSPEDQRAYFDDRRQRVEARRVANKEWLQDRGVAERASDFGTFMASAPVRTFTRGKYGIGDVVPGETGDRLTEAEIDFIRANRDELETVAAAGEVALGIPALEQLGAPARGISATLRTVRPKLDDRLSATRRAILNKADERLKDTKAFEDLGVKPFGPSLADKGSARFARTVEELPIVGRTVKGPKSAVEEALKSTQGRIVSELGAPASDEGAGLVVQRGLDRFRSSKLPEMEPDQLRRIGVQPDRAPSRRSGDDLIISPERFSTQSMTPQQLRQAARADVSFPTTTRRSVDELSMKELSNIIMRPARDTSLATKQEALYARAHKMLPALFKRDATRDSGQFATREAKRVLDGMLKAEQSAKISGGVLTGRFGQMVESLRDPRSTWNIDTLRSARTEVGRALRGEKIGEVTLGRTELKQLYGALSRDLERMYVGIAARARERTRLPMTDKRRVSPDVADKADRALRSFRQADKYFRESNARMDRVLNIVGAKSFEEAARRLGRYLRENTQDIETLRTIKRSLRPEEWRQLSGYVISKLGTGRAGSKEAEDIFNVAHWATDWNKIGPSGKQLLMDGLDPKLRQSLDNLARVVERMKFYESTTNYSGTAYSLTGILGGASLFTPGAVVALIANVGGMAAVGKMMTSRAYVNWLNRAYQLELMGASSNQMAAHLRDLAAIAAKDIDLGHHVLRAIGSLEQSATAQEPEPGQQAQPVPAVSFQDQTVAEPR